MLCIHTHKLIAFLTRSVFLAHTQGREMVNYEIGMKLNKFMIAITTYPTNKAVDAIAVPEAKLYTNIIN